jgi:putative peptide zinc metalloprotease protein
MKSAFSESWYQVANERVGILPTVRVHKQLYRDRVWYVLQDSCSEKYFRVTEVAYRFLARLAPEKTVEQHWAEFVMAYPDEAPTQDDVIGLLAQLHQSNLLLYRSAGNSRFLFERFRQQHRRERLSHLLAFLYFRLPVWNPNNFLKVRIGWLSKLFSPIAFGLWCLVLLWGGKTVVENWTSFSGQAQGVLSVDNLFWLYVAMFGLKICHEMGHAIVCRKHGGNVHNMGVMFIALAPLPYIDASASWSLRDRWQRAEVGVAGMYVELFIAAIAAVIWSQTAPGFVNSLAFNVMVIGSVSSLLFNGNPLLKFDAYYILSDAMDMPNLYQKAMQQWFWAGKRWILSAQDAEEPATNALERRWYYGYGALSFAYRCFVMGAILLYMADLSLFLGALMLVTLLWMWVISPFSNLVKYLLDSPELRHNRTRAASSTAVVLGLIVAWLAWVPMPYSMTVPGVVQSQQRTVLFAEAGGVLEALRVRDGQYVRAGDVLMVFRHLDLELEHELTGQQLVEVRWLIRDATERSMADLTALREREAFLLGRLDDIEGRLNRLTVVAESDGIWAGSVGMDRIGSYVPRHQRLGTLTVGDHKHFVAVVSQDQVSGLLMERETPSGHILLVGSPHAPMPTDKLQLIPYQRYELPSAALGIPGGGRIHAQVQNDGRVLANEPFFEVFTVLPAQAAANVPDGALGYLRIVLPFKPWLEQGILALQQLMQSRYAL